MAEDNDEDDSLLSGDLITGPTDEDFETPSFVYDIEEIRDEMQRQNKILEHQSDRQTRQLILMVVLMALTTGLALPPVYLRTSTIWPTVVTLVPGLVAVAGSLWWIYKSE